MMSPEDHIPSMASIVPYYVLAQLGYFLVSAICFFRSTDFIGH